MRKILSVLIICVCFVFVLNLMSNDVTYVGSNKCKMCHKSEKQGKQFPLWQERKHSKSFAALQSESAIEIAKELGIEGSPAESPKCLKCHGPLSEKAAELKEEGVTCEVCHGPGSAYKKMKVMKDHKASVENGMSEYKTDEDIKKKCLSCHTDAHDKPFDFDKAWAKINHSKPE